MNSRIPFALLLTLAACGPEVAPTGSPAPAKPDAAALAARAAAYFKPLPADMASEQNPLTDAKVTLGRTLYADPRLSKNHDVSCSSCHDLAAYGVDGKPTSTGHKAQQGGRNAPTVYNAALHLAQFWDGRAPDVEEQAKGPVLNPVEMAMPSGDAVVAVLESIPGYTDLFQAAFPDAPEPITYDNMAAAIGAFERRLVTPSPFDRFLGGDLTALNDDQLRGLQTFMDTGCTACHMGATVGGTLYQKVGVVKPYETADNGRFDITQSEADRKVFKVPSLRNIEKTGPYFHDGRVATLDDAIRLMAEHQLGKTLDDAAVADIKTFLGSLTGALPADLITAPPLPDSGPNTPAPNPS